jgi:hypothetical protein
MVIVTLKRMNIQVTLREVEIDVHLDAGPKTTIIIGNCLATTIVNRRVMSLIQKLA